MPVYISLLRGINVGPHKRMKMEKLRSSCEILGLKQVKTFIQSGNLIFETEKTSPAALSKKIEAQILSDFGFSVDVISRTKDEMGKIIRGNPLLKEKNIDPSKLHVAFLSEIAPWVRKSISIFQMECRAAVCGSIHWIVCCRYPPPCGIGIR
jgi:uncharacterized protein (DUF1697 family)